MHRNPSVTKKSIWFFAWTATAAFVYHWFPELVRRNNPTTDCIDADTDMSLDVANSCFTAYYLLDGPR